MDQTKMKTVEEHIFSRHCEERSDEAIPHIVNEIASSASSLLAMTKN